MLLLYLHDALPISATPVLSHVVRATLGRRPANPVGTPFGRDVPGVLGLAAGMDKDATTVLGMDMLGFGHVEVGTITAQPQPGNDRPQIGRASCRAGGWPRA